MARPPKPTKVLEITGAFKRNPNRKRPGEPIPTGGIGPYAKGSLDKAEIWDEIVGQCAPGVLTNADRLALEIAVEYVHQFRTNPVKFSAARIHVLVALLGRFGMTPADRAKMHLPEAPKSGAEVAPWSKFLTS